MIQLQIETINQCNAHCVFCPYTEQTRKRMVMPMPLFRKIIDEAAAIPLVDAVTLVGLGEPLLDPHLCERIKYIKDTLGSRIRTDVYTNGSKLTLEKAEELQSAGLDVLYVSLNAIDRQKRFEQMGLDDYERVEAVLHECLAKVKKTQIIVKAIAAKDLWEGDGLDVFIEKWGGKCEDGGNSFIHMEGNWAGANYKVRTTQKVPCSRALSSIMILSDGRVCLCCQDWDGQVIFGDLNNETLRDIYKKPEYVEYRRQHIEGNRSQLFLCKDCTMV